MSPTSSPASRCISRRGGAGWSRGLLRAAAALFVISAAVLFTRGVGVWGLNIPVNWAFAIHNYVWWLGIGHAGTLISAMLLLTRQRLAQFAQPLRRDDDAVRGGLRRHLSDPASGPAVVLLLDAALSRDHGRVAAIPQPAGMGYLGGPDLSHRLGGVLVYRAHSRSRRGARPRAAARWQIFFGILALGWRGSAIHWARWRQAYRLTAALAVPLVVSVHSEISLLFAAGQIPGWHSTIFPPYFVLGAAFSGFAVVSMIAIALRHWFGLQSRHQRASRPARQSVARLTGLMTAYGYVFEIFDTLYSGDAHDLQTLHRPLAAPMPGAIGAR